MLGEKKRRTFFEDLEENQWAVSDASAAGLPEQNKNQMRYKNHET